MQPRVPKHYDLNECESAILLKLNEEVAHQQGQEFKLLAGSPAREALCYV